MKTDRHQQIEELFNATLERKPEERAAFLKQACGGDETLRLEVESVLAYDERAGSFIEAPPANVAAALVAQQEQSMLGRILGHYRLVSLMGVGGMGEVYLAEDTKLRRKVAIKLLTPESAADEQAKKRLIREAQAAAALDHPNICAIHEVGEDNGHSFIVMQYVEGETLSDRIQIRPFELNETIDIAVQVADALSQAHSRGITHRDIKPQNIMLSAKNHVKVLDFGLAKLARERQVIGTEAVTDSLSVPGAIAGTIPYMSPEQVRGESVDARSDIFSFGVVLYEMISGRQPFATGGVAATFSAILTHEPPPLARYAAQVPDELQRIVRKCMDKDKQRRYQSTQDLLVDLSNLKKDPARDTIADGSAVRPQPTRGKALYLAFALMFLVLGVVAMYFMTRESPPASDNPIHSLAVLPFVNAGGEPNAEYLSDGITESLINSFSQLPQLKVMARTTAFRYKGKDTDAQVIGRDLHVDAIITGRVTQQGDTLIVQADLLRSADGSQIWGEKYSRKLSDIFAVEEQITREISGKLRLRLTGEQKLVLARRYTENIEAYQNYLLGWTYLQRRTRQDFSTAISYFEKAIQEEPNYALAYAGLTEAYVSLTARGLIEPVEGRRKTEEAAKKALSLDPNSAESHAATASRYLSFAPYDFPTGDQELRHAIELSPSMAEAYLVFGMSLSEQGRLDEGLEMWLKARELDPLSPLVARLVASSYLMKRDYSKALGLLQHSSELGPSFITISEIEIYVRGGALDEGMRELEKAKRDREDEPALIYSTGMAYASQNRHKEALGIIKWLEQAPGLTHAHFIARIYAALNDKEMALASLERGFDAGAIPIFNKDAPVWDSVRDEPRFRDLLRRMRIPQ